MADYKIENDDLSVTLSSHGAEIVSIVSKKTGKEYLWNADEKYWKRHSPILFPFVGSLKNKEYVYNGKTYPMGQHGFARDMRFSLKESNDNVIWFELEYNKKTLEMYPFKFVLDIGYVLEDNMISVLWKVENKDDKEMYFSIGAHPAFNCPINEDESQSDCYIKTDCINDIKFYKIEETSGLKDTTKVYTMPTEDGIFKIDEHLFDDDALIIEDNQVNVLSILDSNKKEYVRVMFDMPLCGIWSPAKKAAPFICLEPWSGRCDATGFNGELQDREYGNKLQPSEVFDEGYTIQIFDDYEV